MPTSRPPRPRPIRNIAPISPPIFNEEEETERDARLGERIQIVGENSIGTTPVGLQDAPDAPQEVRLFVKGTNAGYDSVKDIYILFQSVLQ
ncbi:hypothetical protein LCGC14_1941510, partial [marine sediment metagenome]